jgi:hypothetical protein
VWAGLLGVTKGAPRPHGPERSFLRALDRLCGALYALQACAVVACDGAGGQGALLARHVALVLSLSLHLRTQRWPLSAFTVTLFGAFADTLFGAFADTLFWWLVQAKKGSFRETPPDLLCIAVLKGLLERTGVAGADIGDICFGNVLQPGGWLPGPRPPPQRKATKFPLVPFVGCAMGAGGVDAGAGGVGVPFLTDCPCPVHGAHACFAMACHRAGAGAVMGRMAQLVAGIPYTVPASAVNRQCSSGLQAVMNIANGIKAGNVRGVAARACLCPCTCALVCVCVRDVAVDAAAAVAVAAVVVVVGFVMLGIFSIACLVVLVPDACVAPPHRSCLLAVLVRHWHRRGEHVHQRHGEGRARRVLGPCWRRQSGI